MLSASGGSQEGLFCSGSEAQCPSLVLLSTLEAQGSSPERSHMWPLVWRKAKCSCLTHYLGGQQIQSLQLLEGQNELCGFPGTLRTRSGPGKF